MELPRPFGPYTLLNRLAVGGMAEVYVAKTVGLGGFEKQVALKVVHPHLSANEHFTRMLVDEAKVLVKLNHANIAQVLDLGRIGGDHYIAMEYVDGWNLHQIVTAARELARPLPVEMAAYVLAEVCSGLDYAHRKRDDDGRPLGLVHRDVSPQNILVSQSGEVKLVDFGIAKGSHRGEGTEVGVIKGKYNYMSPEQAWADPMDRRSDLYSAGVVIWEVLAGRMLHEERSVPKLIARVRDGQVQPLEQVRPDVPDALAVIVRKATAADAVDRYQSAADLGEALRDFVYRQAPSFNARRLSSMVGELMAQHADLVERQPPPKAEDEPEVFMHTHEAFPPQDLPSGPAVVTRADVPSASPQRARLPPLPFDSVAPPTEKMAKPPSRVSAWPAPEFAPPTTTAPHRPVDSWGPEEPTVQDVHRNLSPDALTQLRGGDTGAFGSATFEADTTSRYRAELARSAAAAADPFSGSADRTAPQRAQSRTAVRPPPSGTEPIPPLPPSAPLPEVDRRGRLTSRRSGRRNLALAAAGALVACLIGVLAWRVWGATRPVAALEIVSEPPNATVTVDGVEQASTTPLRIENFEPGRDYDLTVGKDGYDEWAGTYHAASGVVQHIAVLRPLKAELFIATEPPGAALSIDGVPVGSAPLRVSALDPGRQIVVRAELEGYKEVVKPFVIAADDLRPRLDLVLPPKRR